MNSLHPVVLRCRQQNKPFSRKFSFYTFMKDNVSPPLPDTPTEMVMISLWDGCDFPPVPETPSRILMISHCNGDEFPRRWWWFLTKGNLPPPIPDTPTEVLFPRALLVKAQSWPEAPICQKYKYNYTNTNLSTQIQIQVLKYKSKYTNINTCHNQRPAPARWVVIHCMWFTTSEPHTQVGNIQQQ